MRINPTGPVLLLLFFLTTGTSVQAADASAATLRMRHTALVGQLAHNAYHRPLYLESSDGPNSVSGDAYAVLNAPFSAVSATFKSPRAWCEILILHQNTKYCHASSDANPSLLSLNVGKKSEEDLRSTFSLTFTYSLVAATRDYLAVTLSAGDGPMGSHDYRIELQAVPLAKGKSFIHLRYSYAFGTAARLAMEGYLATGGRGKVGFTRDDTATPPAYIGGVRGAVERNTMRYYLAIEAYLASLGQPPALQFSRRSEAWFDATEQFSLQLHEMDRTSYLAMKRSEHARQLSAAPE